MSASSSTSSRFELSTGTALVLVTLLGLACAAYSLIQSPADPLLWAGVALLVLLAGLGLYSQRREAELLDRINTVLDSAARGQLEPRVTHIPGQGRMVNAGPDRSGVPRVHHRGLAHGRR